LGEVEYDVVVDHFLDGDAIHRLDPLPPVLVYLIDILVSLIPFQPQSILDGLDPVLRVGDDSYPEDMADSWEKQVTRSTVIYESSINRTVAQKGPAKGEVVFSFRS
jgi:hypothetical protein